MIVIRAFSEGAMLEAQWILKRELPGQFLTCEGREEQQEPALTGGPAPHNPGPATPPKGVWRFSKS